MIILDGADIVILLAVGIVLLTLLCDAIASRIEKERNRRRDKRRIMHGAAKEE